MLSVKSVTVSGKIISSGETVVTPKIGHVNKLPRVPSAVATKWHTTTSYYLLELANTIRDIKCAQPASFF